MNDLIFELKDVYFSYLGKYPALSEINLEIHRGQKIAIIGANGSGKSTLLQLLDGLIFPDKGKVMVWGRELNEDLLSEQNFSQQFRRRVGMVFQNPDIQLFCPTVKEDIVFGPLQLGIAKEEINFRLGKLVALLNIGDLLNRSPHQLSVGEKRKVAIAATLAIDPDVILLDEPTAGLDPTTVTQIIDLIIQADHSTKTIVTITQDLPIVEEIAEIVYVIDRQRKIARSGTPEQILSDVQFLQDNNLIHIHRHRHQDQIHSHPHSHLHMEHPHES